MFSHYAAVMCLADDAQAQAVIVDAVRHGWSDNRTLIEARRVKFGFYKKHSEDVVPTLEGLIQRDAKFGAICADCPWQFDERSNCLVKWGSDIHYQSMADEELAALPVRKVSTNYTTLFLFCPSAMLERAFPLMRAWGFRFAQCELIWHKTPARRGVGFRPRMVHEHLLIGIREQSPIWSGDIQSVVEAPRPGRHSQKPDIFFDIIERAVPGPYLEIFGRRKRHGWTVVGDQIDDDDTDYPDRGFGK